MERAADIRKMKTHNSISKDEIIQSHNELYDKLSTLQADNERLTQWVNDLQTGMYVNCVYCGHRYGPRGKTPVSMADVLKKHIETCPKHPMSLLKAEHERDYADMRRFQDNFIRVDQELKALQADIDGGKLVRLKFPPHTFIFWINENREIEKDWKYLGFLWQMHDGMAMIYHGSKPFVFKLMFEEDVYLTEEAAHAALEGDPLA